MRSELGRPNWTRADLEAKTDEWLERWKGRVPEECVEPIYDMLMDNKKDNFEFTSIDFLNAVPLLRQRASAVPKGPNPCTYCKFYEQNKGEVRPCPVHRKG